MTDTHRVLRTPDDAFSGIAGFPYPPHYTTVDGGDLGPLRMAHIDEGEGPVVLCLHGEPSWSYLYRSMIPVFVEGGCRVLAPDLIGFGRSDKPAAVGDYSYQGHLDWLSEWFLGLDLSEVTLVAQDWGGLLGLRLLAAHPDRFARFSIANTGLPAGDQPMPDAFLAWRRFSLEDPDFDIGFICNEFGGGGLTDAEVDAFRAPFPDNAYKAGARAFPSLVPAEPDNPASEANRRAWDVLRAWEKPALLCFSDGDPITRGGEGVFLAQVPGCAKQPHITLSGGHFIQNHDGPRWARAILDWMKH
jgi:haloalkane dehalogenase